MRARAVRGVRGRTRDRSRGDPDPGEKTPWEKTTGRTSAVELHEAVCRCRMPDEMRATWGAHTKDLWKALALPS